MAQLMLTQDFSNQPELRDHLRQNIEDLEMLLPEESPVTVRIKKISKHVFGADVRARLMGRLIVVSAQGTDVFQALSRARKHLMRQIEDIRGRKRNRLRHPRRHLQPVT
jgi:ribosome-associated translation inhibitor RaiA